MKKKLLITAFILCVISFFSWAEGPRIYLYGETHSNKVILDAELKVWKNFYDNKNMRHLFIEYGFATAELLNQWMKAEDDSLLNLIYESWKGSIADDKNNLEFYKSIKQSCPETIFHGTDVGHGYDITGEFLLHQLEEKGEADSPKYQIVLENIDQLKHYKKYNDMAIRENYMAANFIREFDSLPENEIIMGIYGSAHTSFVVDLTGKVPSMIAQIRKKYNDENKELIQVYDISKLYHNVYWEPPYGIEYFKIKGKNYKASYFGEQDLTGVRNYKCRKYWRIENPDSTLLNLKAKSDCLPYDNYIMNINLGDVLRIEYTKMNNSKFVIYYRADGNTLENQPCTNRILKE